MSIENIKKLRDSGMRKKDKEFWGGVHNHNIWYCWLNIVIDYLENRAKRSGKIKKSVSVNLEKSDSVQA